MAFLTIAATAFLIIISFARGRGVMNNYSDAIVLMTARYYASELDRAIETSENGEVDPETYELIVSSAYTYEENNAFLISKDGELLYRSYFYYNQPSGDVQAVLDRFIEKSLALEKDETHRGQILPDKNLGKVVVEELSNGMFFIVAVHKTSVAVPQMKMFPLFIFISVIVFIILFVASILMVRSIIKPLKRMTDIADKYANGDYTEKMEVERKDEVGKLSRSLQTMSESLMNQVEIADAANDAKTAFLSNMSHEIRTPITAMLGFNEMILRESDDADILSYAEKVDASGHTLLGLINDVLDFSKIEAGKIEVIPVDYDLSSVINDLVNMITVRAEEKGLSLALDFDKNIPKILNGDEVRIKQIITNILTNAVKYTEIGSVTFSIGYEKIKDDPDSVNIKVSVKDTGIGIRKEDMDRIFSKFERVDVKRNRNIEGTGLGMTITRSLLDMMGSDLEVESTYGLGSVFSFTLKQKVVKWEPLGDYKVSYNKRAGEKEHYKSTFTAVKARILIVDDNETNLLVFKNLMKQTLIKIDTAISGDECLRRCAREKYDIIFLDHMMPKKDGIETLHELNELETSQNKDTPVICLTANAVSGAREEYLKEGFIDYLTKPIDPEKLEKMVLEYLPKDKIDEKKVSSDSKDEAVSINGSLLEGYIDVHTGLRHLGSTDTYITILRSFSDAVEKNIKEMEQYLEEENFEDYSILIHGIKSNCRTVGAGKLGEMAESLEHVSDSQDGPLLRDKHIEFVKEYRELKEVLDRAI
jgi:signal transduction histidine kinase/CheY-like chemotaxis protein/HPt (histidine-containing phosphotransfer) domain-containing protein